MSECVIHANDFSWFGDSNQVLNRKKPPRTQYKNKLKKKKDIIELAIKMED